MLRVERKELNQATVKLSRPAAWCTKMPFLRREILRSLFDPFSMQQSVRTRSDAIDDGEVCTKMG